MPLDHSIREQAAGWAVRTGDPGFDDWDAFTEWLERDPAHATAYDAVSAAVADAAQAQADAALPVAANQEDDEPPARTPLTRRRWLGGALAACLVTLMLVGVWRGDGDVYETAPGETRQIALADGGTVLLAGGSKLVLDGDDKRSVSLEAGQALFTVTHDEANPFRVEVAGDTLVDIGTVFDVRTGNGALRVAVAEGAVAFNPDQQNVTLKPGDMLARPGGSTDYTVTRVAPEQVGEWREGRLTYQQATLAEVAADLSRSTGIAFSAAPGSAGAAVSGSFLVAPVENDPRALGPLLGVSVARSGDGWVIEAQ